MKKVDWKVDRDLDMTVPDNEVAPIIDRLANDKFR